VFFRNYGDKFNLKVVYKISQVIKYLKDNAAVFRRNGQGCRLLFATDGLHGGCRQTEVSN